MQQNQCVNSSMAYLVSGGYCVILILGFCRCLQVLAEENEANDEEVSPDCMVRNLTARPFIDTRSSGIPCSFISTTSLCKVILNITWVRPVNEACVSRYTVNIEKMDSSSASGYLEDTSLCAENHSVPVNPSATYLALSHELDVPLWTHCMYNVSVVTQSVHDNVSRSVSIVKTTAELEDEGPELVLVLKEWFPLPNGYYHLRAVFNIKNYIHRITLPQAYSVGSNNADIALWHNGSVVTITTTVRALRNPADSYNVRVGIALNFVDPHVEELLAAEPYTMWLLAPALPPGPVQNLSVAGALDGDVVDLHIQWRAPMEVNTDGEVQYDVLLHGGNGTLERWDNHSLLHKYRVEVRGVNVEYGVMGNWSEAALPVPSGVGNGTEAVLPDPVDGPSDGVSLLIKHVIIKLQPAVLPPLAAAIVIFLLSVCAACFCARKCSNHCALSKVVKRTNGKTLLAVVSFDHIISRSNFSCVFSAHFLDERAKELHGVVGDQVAAKVILACKETEANIQREIDILHTLKRGNCVNVVKMFDFGWDSCGTAATIVMEFVEYGSLVEYLEWSGKKIQNHPFQEEANPLMPYDTLGAVSEDDQLSFAVQISRGMEYIAGCGVIHCDLACRNVLLGKEKTVKIADFGLAQTGPVCTLYQAELPFRWMAPEAIATRQASTKTDVWAFGVTLWEVWSYGEVPLVHMTNEEVIEAAATDPSCALKQPQTCKMDVWDVMLECWNTTQHSRPDFSQLTEMMSKIWLKADEQDIDITT